LPLRLAERGRRTVPPAPEVEGECLDDGRCKVSLVTPQHQRPVESLRLLTLPSPQHHILCTLDFELEALADALVRVGAPPDVGLRLDERLRNADVQDIPWRGVRS